MWTSWSEDVDCNFWRVLCSKVTRNLNSWDLDQYESLSKIAQWKENVSIFTEDRDLFVYNMYLKNLSFFSNIVISVRMWYQSSLSIKRQVFFLLSLAVSFFSCSRKIEENDNADSNAISVIERFHVTNMMTSCYSHFNDVNLIFFMKFFLYRSFRNQSFHE